MYCGSSSDEVQEASERGIDKGCWTTHVDTIEQSLYVDLPDAARKNGGTRKKSSMGTDGSGERSSTWVMVSTWCSGGVWTDLDKFSVILAWCHIAVSSSPDRGKLHFYLLTLYLTCYGFLGLPLETVSSKSTFLVTVGLGCGLAWRGGRMWSQWPTMYVAHPFTTGKFTHATHPGLYQAMELCEWQQGEPFPCL